MLLPRRSSTRWICGAATVKTMTLFTGIPDVGGLGPGQLRTAASRSADLGDVDAAADQRLHGPRARGDVNQLHVQTVTLKKARLLGDPGKRKRRRDRGVSDAELLRRFGRIRKAREQTDGEQDAQR